MNKHRSDMEKQRIVFESVIVEINYTEHHILFAIGTRMVEANHCFSVDINSLKHIHRNDSRLFI